MRFSQYCRKSKQDKTLPAEDTVTTKLWMRDKYFSGKYKLGKYTFTRYAL